MVNEKQMRYSNEEMSLIKNTFADNDVLLKTLRKFLLQLPYEQKDLELLKTSPVLRLLKKTFLPELEGDAPLLQVIDMWSVVQIINKPPVEAIVTIKAWKILESYLRQQIGNLENSTEIDTLKLSDLTKISETDEEIVSKDFINLTARISILGYIESQLNQLKTLAGQKSETVEETKKRLLANSSK